MNFKRFRDWVFLLHRYIGLLIGFILVIVGLTGSVLVFENELDQLVIQRQFGQVVPQEHRLPLNDIAASVKTSYADRPDLKLAQFAHRLDDTVYKIRLKDSVGQQLEVFVNPYTGKILGDRPRDSAFFSRVLELHYTLLAGEVGRAIIGIVALLVCILSVTGLMLWSGWRKLSAGFRIKWNAHPKRRHFDVHKIVGVVFVTFLVITAFTGFCWNFYDSVEPLIYAATVSPPPPKVKSTEVTGKASLPIDAVLQRADAALPNAITSHISVPTTADGVFYVFKTRSQDLGKNENLIQIDQYSGEVLHVVNSQTASLGDRILNSFTPLHYGTFWGLPSRIFYIFVGLAPLILFITGSVMWWYRRRKRDRTQFSPHTATTIYSDIKK